jgi:hypothetical protein
MRVALSDDRVFSFRYDYTKCAQSSTPPVPPLTMLTELTSVLGVN